MPPGRPAAVVFDLFGTLVSWPPGSPHTHAMAERLAIDHDRFRSMWSKTRRERDRGELTAEEALRDLCAEIGVVRDETEIAHAAAERSSFLRRVLVPRDGALDVLGALRSRGLPIGLLSDASNEAPFLWPETALAPLVDAAVFSCEEHAIKPDPRLYRVVADRLGVEPTDCVYVGNGDGGELSGALRAGMLAVLFSAPGEWPGREAGSWSGPRISRLKELLSLLPSTREAQ